MRVKEEVKNEGANKRPRNDSQLHSAAFELAQSTQTNGSVSAP